jgi:pimeloyl-ACP methyl ester carboxylesterase
MLDLAQHVDELPAPTWHGPTLILAAADDPLITPTHRQSLLDAHPGHELHVFPDGGHSLLLTRPTDYLTKVTRHLHRTVSSGPPRQQPVLDTD